MSFHPSSSACRFPCAMAAAAVVTLGVAGCGSDSGGGGSGGEDFPTENITLVVPSAAGGGFDTSARQLQPYLEEELGVNVIVENAEGGGFAIGADKLLRQGDDCSSIMIHGVPLLQFSYLAQEVDYTYDDFYPVGGYTIEPGVIRVGKDTPYQTLEELVRAGRENPGEVRVSISGLTDNNHLAIRQIEDATGARFNIVPYDGGGPARTAVISGEVEWTHAGMFNSLGIAEGSRVVAVQQDENEWPELTDNAPTVDEALGMDLPENETTYGLYVTSTCHEQSPERYQILVDAYEAATSNPEFVQTLEELGEAAKLRVVPAAEYDDVNRMADEELREVVDELMAPRPTS